MSVDPMELMSHSRAYERSLIGTLLVGGAAAAEDVIEWLKPGAFGESSCKQAYQAMLACWKDRHDWNLVTIDYGYEKIGVDINKVDRAGLIAMTTEAPFGSPSREYADLIVKAAEARMRADLGAKLAANSFKHDNDAFERAFREGMDSIKALAPKNDGPVLISDFVAEEQERIQLAWEGKWEEEVIPTGFRNLDESLTGGMRRGELIVLAGRPGSGKTACAIQWMQNHNRRGLGDTIFFSAEMSARAVIKRAIAEASGIPARGLYWPTHTHDNKNKILRAIDAMMSYPFAIDSTAGITTDQMISRVTRYQKQRPVDLVVFDFLELAGDRDSAGEEQRVAHIARQMKKLALQCDVPVVLISQLSRAVESRKDRIPVMSDLRYSGSVEAAADIIGFLYREDYYVGQGLMESTPGKEGTCDFILAKQREGTTGTYTVKFDPYSLRFSDYGDNTRRVA